MNEAKIETMAEREVAQTYVDEIERWRQARHAELTRPDGWLSLAGLFWLDPGENSFGSSADQSVRFPDKAPAHVGAFTLGETGVSVTIDPAVDVRHEGEPVRRMDLVADYDDGPATVLTHGTLRWHIIKRGDRYGVRLKDAQSPFLTEFRGVDAFPADSRWRVEAVLEPSDPPRLIPVPTVLGTVMERTSPGALLFRIDGTEYRLDALGDSRGVDLRLIFADATTGKETYGGGRFLDVAGVDERGRTVIDFNRAFNPPCAFTPHATCPRPPQGNRLPIAVTAGEKRYEAPESVTAS